MQRIIVYLLVASFGWYAYAKYQDRVKAGHFAATEVQPSKPRAVSASEPTAFRAAPAPAETSTTVAFACDGRIYCNQMTSCAEATYFLKNCPGTKMDGDNDGVPCESQWCNK